MKGSEYDIEYFLTNQYFIDWVKHPEKENGEFWNKWLKNHPESRDAFYLAKGMVEQVGFRDDPAIGKRKDEILDHILKEQASDHYPDGSQSEAKLKVLLPWVLRLVAASVALVMVMTYILSSFPVDTLSSESAQIAFLTKENPKGQKSAFFLPDKSRVILNAGSTISFPAEFGDIREVFLEGEAYFDVAHDEARTFLVHTGEVVTEVHGTAFTVQAYPNERVNVALERGLVSVYPLRQTEPVIPQYLKPGEMLTVHRDFDRSVKSTFDYELQFGWKEGKLVFRNASMGTLVKELERWYGVEITVMGDPGDHWKVSGVFQHESLENVLEGVKYARNITYEIDGAKVKIKTKP